MINVVLPFLAYLMGSVSTAILVARLSGLKDPREVGSGNPGATNILRYGGKKAAILTLAGDITKGVIPVVAAHLLNAESPVMAATMLAVFLGHLFPVFHGFKGGKGVATAAGALTALHPWVGLTLVAAWLGTALVTRYSSLSALLAAVTSPVAVWWFTGEPWRTGATAVMCAILLWRHRSNIRNLLAGKEPKIGKSKA